MGSLNEGWIFKGNKLKSKNSANDCKKLFPLRFFFWIVVSFRIAILNKGERRKCNCLSILLYIITFPSLQLLLRPCTSSDLKPCCLLLCYFLSTFDKTENFGQYLLRLAKRTISLCTKKLLICFFLNWHHSIYLTAKLNFCEKKYNKLWNISRLFQSQQHFCWCQFSWSVIEWNTATNRFSAATAACKCYNSFWCFVFCRQKSICQSTLSHFYLTTMNESQYLMDPD